MLELTTLTYILKVNDLIRYNFGKFKGDYLANVVCTPVDGPQSRSANHGDEVTRCIPAGCAAS